MFDFLTHAAAHDALDAGHHAIQLIRQWAFTSGQSAGIESLPPAQAKLARQIVNEIETREGKSIIDLPYMKVDQYITAVSDRLQELSRKRFHADPGKGRDLLMKLRSEEI